MSLIIPLRAFLGVQLSVFLKTILFSPSNSGKHALRHLQGEQEEGSDVDSVGCGDSKAEQELPACPAP